MNGFINFNAVESTSSSGHMISDYLKKNVTDSFGEPITIQKYMDHIKENHCFVSLDLEKDLAETRSQTHELPDGTPFSLSSEAFMSSECLFDSQNTFSISNSVIDSLNNFSFYGTYIFFYFGFLFKLFDLKLFSNSEFCIFIF